MNHLYVNHLYVISKKNAPLELFSKFLRSYGMKPKPSHTRISKFLSLVLRHRPEKIGLELDPQGWAEVNPLIDKLNAHGLMVSRKILEEVVATNPKKRFALNDDQTKIRANQGHSIQIDHGFKPTEPPEILYHGTAQKFLKSILATGIQKRNRHHVHLSADLDTATNVGQRHGKVVILHVRALEMHKAGAEFYLSENGVWLTDEVKVAYIDY